MALNPYFLQGAKSEQSLVQSLINEQLKMYGVDIYYIPRRYISQNTVIREVVESQFDSAYPIEAYIDSYEGYGGQGTLLSKFGIQNVDDLTLVISRERYETYITPLIKNIPNIELATRPKEGDLIYFPLGDRLFEIKYVEHEQPFYQLKKNYVYQLRCELFRYEDEVIDTGVETIDDEVEQLGYIATLTLIGAATTATATASYVSTGGVQQIYMSNMGNGYQSQPLIGISSSPSGSENAVGVASIANTWIDCNTGLTDGKISAVHISNAGAGYTEAPWLTIQDPTGFGVGAAGTVGITTRGSIGVVTISGGGSGYTTHPTFTVSAPGAPTGIGSTSAHGIGYINAAGIVTVAYITNAGVGYSEVPTVTFEAPTGAGVGMGTGSFVFNETITGQTSGATARVKEWDAVNNTLEISGISSNFSNGETIIGSNSGAKFAVRKTNKDDLVSGFAENDVIQSAGDDIIDFTETNPFGMP